MNDWRLNAIRYFSFIQDLSVVYILSVPPFLIDGRLPSPGPQAASALAAVIMYLLLRPIPKAAAPVSAAAALAAGLFFGLTWFHAAFLGVIAAWRIVAHAGKEPEQTEFIASFGSITYGLTAIFFTGMNDAGNQLMKILMIQFAVAVVIRTARSVYGASGDRKKRDWAFGRLAVGLTVLTLLVINFEAFLAMLGASFGWLITALGRLLGFMSYPLLRPMDGVIGWLDAKNEQRKDGESEAEKAVRPDEEFMYPAGDVGTEAGSLVLFLILGSVLAGLLIYLFRRHSGGKKAHRSVNPYEIRHREDEFHNKRKRIGIRNPVRKEVQRLELKMMRVGFGRRPDQTFADWLLTLGVSGKEASALRDVYARVRYGEKPVSRQEAEDFRYRIRAIGKDVSGKHRKER